MLEYSLDDAEALLTKNLDAAKKSLESVESDIDFLKDQTTTVEVSILFESGKTINVVHICLLILLTSNLQALSLYCSQHSRTMLG